MYQIQKKRRKIKRFKSFSLVAMILIIVSIVGIYFVDEQHKSREVFAESIDRQTLNFINSLDIDSLELSNTDINVSNENITNFRAEYSDIRILALKDYFRLMKSPLTNQADMFVKYADTHNLQKWALLPAIATVETGGCTTDRGLPYKKKNCWGWGGGGSNMIIFDNWDTAISNITQSLAKRNTDPYIMQATYCPPCQAAGTNEWARGVTSQIAVIEKIAIKYGYKK